MKAERQAAGTATIPAKGAPPRTRPVTAAELVPRPGFYRRHERTILPTATILLILALWELWGRVVGIDPLFFSYPSEIWEGFRELTQEGLVHDLGVSAAEFAIGLGIALVGVPLGMLIGSNRRLLYAFDPIINGLYATPTLALAPLFVIWFGLGIWSKVVVVAVMAFFPLIINAIEGVRTVDPNLVRAVRTFGGRRVDVYRDVVFPSIVPFVVSGLRLAIGRAIIAVVIGEFIAATAGIGHQIRISAANFQTGEYLAAVGILVAASMLLNALLKRLERRLAPWRSAQASEE